MSNQKDTTGEYQAPRNKVLEVFGIADTHEFVSQMYYPDVEIGELPEGTEWLSLAKAEIPQAVKDYVKEIETGETSKWCKCPWAVHPDDKGIPVDHCVACGEHKDAIHHVQRPVVTKEEADKGWHHVKGRRIRRMDTHELCPVHTKEGLVLGLFEYLFKEDDETPPPGSD